MGKIEKVKLWFIDVTGYQVSTNDARKLLDMLGVVEEEE